jgi:hypothetical protein
MVAGTSSLGESWLAIRRDGGTRDVFLCHSFCEIGAVRMVDEFTWIKSWLVSHQRVVLVFVTPGHLDWYRDAFTYMQEAPFSQPTTADSLANSTGERSTVPCS